MLTVLLGGARSGKSTFAMELARSAERGVTFIATCPRLEGDDDLQSRIDRHRAERPAGWTTIEEEADLAAALANVSSPIAIVDCLTTWVGNLLVNGMTADDVVAASDRAIAAIEGRDIDVIVVTNEVGSGIIPADELSRSYRDALGRVNQRWVARSDRALLMVAGRALVLQDVTELP